MSFDTDRLKDALLKSMERIKEDSEFIEDFMPKVLDELKESQAKIEELTKELNQAVYNMDKATQDRNKAEAELAIVKEGLEGIADLCHEEIFKRTAGLPESKCRGLKIPSMLAVIEKLALAALKSKGGNDEHIQLP
jgi:chromosome segregation ATPase